jgi:hypothetical protein
MVAEVEDNAGLARRRDNAKRKAGRNSKSNPPAPALYLMLGAFGIAVLALAIVGPKRLRTEALEPLRDAVEPQAKKVWANSRPLWEQVAELLNRAGPTERKALARDFLRWARHFRAG